MSAEILCNCEMSQGFWDGHAPICKKSFVSMGNNEDCCANCRHREKCHGDETEKQRTIQQNKAIHLYCTQLADKLNSGGLDQRKVFSAMREGVEIPWCCETVKQNLWKQIQLAMLNKESTTELSTEEVGRVFVVLSRFLGERFNVSIPFPDRFHGE